MLLSSNAVGTSIPSITKAMLEDVEIPLPQITTLRKIVDIVKLQKKERQLREAIIAKRQLPRYVDTYEEEELIDIVAVQKEIDTLEAELTEVQAKMKGYLKELGY